MPPGEIPDACIRREKKRFIKSYVDISKLERTAGASEPALLVWIHLPLINTLHVTLSFI